VNSERFFDFDRAVTSLLSLVDKYPAFPERSDALYRAASIQEDTQQYRPAAANFERYAELFPNKPDTADTFYRSARNYQKLKDTRNELRIYDTFTKRYGNDPKNAKKIIEGLARTADVFVEQGNERSARGAFERVVAEFDARGLQPNTVEAAHPAKARFMLVEYDFKKYEAMKLQGSLVNQGKTIQEMQKQLAALKSKYGEVTAYKSVDWTLASFYRIGHLYQVFAQALYAAPVPPGMSEEEEEVYRTQLEDVAVPIEDEAVKNFQFAYEKAREFRVTNEWTKRILQSLNKYKPSEYPLFKEERRMRSSEDLSPARLLEPPPPPPPPAPEGADEEATAEGEATP
jgi:tetratricopeptide (TPR) repeat protein